MHDRSPFSPARLRPAALLLCLAMSIAGAVPAVADDAAMYALRATLVADGVSELSTRDELGTAVATDGLVAVVGAPMHDLAGEDAGAVYVFRSDDGEWAREARLTASDAGANHGFGTAVALAGNTIAIGAPRAPGSGGAGQGAVYIFETDGAVWSETHRITAPTGAENDSFGTSIALDGNRLVVGAPRADTDEAEDAGEAHVYELAGSSWLHRATLTPSLPVFSGRFGWAVAAAGNTIAIGTPRANAAAPASGSVTIFVNSGGWTEEQEVTGADSASGDAFGSSISLDGDTLAIGAPLSGGSGAAYIFERDNGAWSERTRLTPANTADGDSTGRAVALLDDSLVIGSPDAGAGGRLAVFTGAGASWQEVATLQPAAGGSGSRFGTSVSRASGVVLTGAPGDSLAGAASGAAWAFTGSGDTWGDGVRFAGIGTAAYDLFGVSVAMDGDTAVVGAPAEDVGSAAEAGAVYVYTREAGSWIRRARLVASVPAAGVQLGTGVDISGDTIVAGAWLADGAVNDGGAVYVFERDGAGWSEAARLAPSALESNDYFGLAVSVSGDTVAGTAAGGSTVFVYRRAAGSWDLEDTLNVFPKPGFSLFNSSIDLFGDVIVVGARFENAAYVYERNGTTWAETARLTSPSGQEEDYFGDPVAVDGDTVAVAAPLENVQGQLDAGAVYLYQRDGASWSVGQRLQSPTPVLEDAFGSGLDINGGTIAIGAPSTRRSGPRAGHAVVFDRNGGSWTPTAVVADPTGQPGAQFGSSIAAGTGALLAGAWSTDRPPGTPDQGAAYVFEAAAPPTEAPRARLTWLPAAPVAGQAVQFVDASSGTPSTWSWDLGDGGTSADPNPLHTYTTPGRYDITLTVTNAFGQDSAAATVVVRDPAEPALPPTVAVAAVARVQGAGTYFSSRLEIFNSGTENLLVDAVYTPRADIGGPARATTFELPATTMLELDDPLGAWFGIEGDATGVGSLMLRVIDGDPDSLLIYSVVSAFNDDGTVYGQLFPAVAGDGGLPEGFFMFLASTSDAAHNRVNFGVMALEDGTRVNLMAFDPLGQTLGSQRTYVLDLGETRQLNNVHQVFGLDPGAEDFVLTVEIIRGRATAYASVVDGVGASYPGTNDPTTILPLIGSQRSTLIALGPVVGLNEFSGSASITNFETFSTTVTASFFARDDGASGPSETTTIVVDGYETVGFQDIVGDLFGVSGVGTVVLDAPPGSTIAATGREFSIQENASGVVTGRAGQLIRGLRDDELLQPGTTAHLLGLRQINTTPVPERSNIVAFNPGDATVRMTLRLYDGASGALEGEKTYPIPPQDLRQVNRVISNINPAQDGEVKRIEVDVDGPLFVQAVRANRHGDPITIDPLPAPASP